MLLACCCCARRISQTSPIGGNPARSTPTALVRAPRDPMPPTWPNAAVLLMVVRTQHARSQIACATTDSWGDPLVSCMDTPWPECSCDTLISWFGCDAQATMAFYMSGLCLCDCTACCAAPEADSSASPPGRPPPHAPLPLAPPSLPPASPPPPSSPPPLAPLPSPPPPQPHPSTPVAATARRAAALRAAANTAAARRAAALHAAAGTAAARRSAKQGGVAPQQRKAAQELD